MFYIRPLRVVYEADKNDVIAVIVFLHRRLCNVGA